MTYDGYEYILLCQQRMNATILNESLCPIGNQRIYQRYSDLGFSILENCYYAVNPNHMSVIYQLDLNFEEIDCIEISDDHESIICAISANPAKLELLLLYANEIRYFDLMKRTIIKNECIPEDRQVMQVIALCDGFILSYQRDGCYYIEVYCSSCASTSLYTIPCGYQLQAIALIGIRGNEDEYCMIYDVQMISRCLDTQEQVCSIIQITCEKEPPKPCDNTCDGGRNEIIHSIALEEAGIAHILNAEGEKIQKAIANDASIEELLSVNESVQRTITKITLLEGQLYIKLDSLHCLCDEDIICDK